MISVTTLTNYLYCQRKLFLERVLKIIEPPKAALILGSLRHECHDLINKTEKKIVRNILKRTSLDGIKQLYKSEFSLILRNSIIKFKSDLKKFEIDIPNLFKQHWPSILMESEIRAENLHKFIEKKKIFGDELWEKLTPKIHSEFPLYSKILGLSGIIDKLEIYENDFIPFELKTGKSPKRGVWENHQIQIAAYLMLLSEKFNKDITTGFIKYLDIDEERAVILNPYLKQYICDLKDKVNLLLDSKHPPSKCSNQNKCLHCGLKEPCFDEVFIDKKLKEMEGLLSSKIL